MKTYFSGGNVEGLMLHGAVEVGYEDGYYFVDMKALLRKNDVQEMRVLEQTPLVGFVIDGIVQVQEVQLKENRFTNRTGKLQMATASFLVPDDQFKGEIELRLSGLLVSDHIPRTKDEAVANPAKLDEMVAIGRVTKNQLRAVRDEVK